ncbi:MAG: 3D domain-containing protein, partial [Clostridia bacterium]
FLHSGKEVVLNVDGKPISATTMKSTVSEVLQQNNVSVGQYDYISLPLDSILVSNTKNVIYIKRAVPVYVKADGQTTKLMTYRSTVEDALKNSPIRLSAFDKLRGLNPNSRIVSEMKINVIRVNKKLVTKNVSTPYGVISRSSSSLSVGDIRLVRSGVKGIIKRTYRVVYENGKLVSKKLVRSRTVRKPVSKIVRRGTASVYRTSRGDNFRYKRVIYMRATAYSNSYQETGLRPGDSGYGATASGMTARVGVIAVDPNVIPLGTRVYIEGLNGGRNYGYAVAGDTGGAISGNRIDVFLNTYQDTCNWGVRDVKVYVL